MKKIISMMMIAIAAMTVVSCDTLDSEGSDDNQYTLTGDKYVGELTTTIPDYDAINQTDIVYYIDANGDDVTIMMPNISFTDASGSLMPNVDMALASIPIVTNNPDVYFAEESQMIGIYDHLPLINSVVQNIYNVEVTINDDDTVTVSFDCDIVTSYFGEKVATVLFEGVKTESSETPDEDEDEDEDESTLQEAFYITTSTGEASQIEGVTMTYYKGDNTLVIDGFKYNNAIPSGATLVIDGLTQSEESSDMRIEGSGIEISYSIMGQACESTVTELTCDIFNNITVINMGFYILYNDYNYLCTYSGAITILDESYSNDTVVTPSFTLDNDPGFYITTSTGTTSLVEGVTVSYYEGDNTLVIDGFKYNTAIPSGATLVIDGVSQSEADGIVTISGSGIEISYSIMGQPCESTVSDLTCEIINSDSQIEFWILYNDFNYPCTYNGEIEVHSSNYTEE